MRMRGAQVSWYLRPLGGVCGQMEYRQAGYATKANKRLVAAIFNRCALFTAPIKAGP